MTVAGLKSLLFIIVLFILNRPLPTFSFALLSHEAIIDASWDKSIVPLLKQKYPSVSEEELKKAHTYAYGGAIIPDIGYFPMGSILFSNLVHYVRSGDFITALLEESRNINEYSFALGVLCHYEADRNGHPLGTNKAVAIMFPKLRKKYGNKVSYEKGHDQHARIEFGFDVLQTAKGNYKPDSYHNFIGFAVNDTVLERAFLKTYGLHLKNIFKSLPIAIEVFRFSVKTIIPELTKDAWKIKNSFITKLNPLATKENYQYKSDKVNYQKEFKQPRIQSIFISLIIGVLPKYGPLSKFKPKFPNEECEKLFEQSYDSIIIHYTRTINKLRTKNFSQTNIDLDTGQETRMGEYKLADKTYYNLLMKLQRGKFENIDMGLKKNVIAYFSNHDITSDYGHHSHKGKKIIEALKQLNASLSDLVIQAK